MPEGHQTHFFAAQHTKLLAGQRLKVTSPQGRFASDARRVTQRNLERVDAAGKNLFYCFNGHRIVHVHLGRYGKFKRHASPPPRPVGQIRMRMIGAAATLDLSGPSTCRLVAAQTRDEIVAKLGPDPLAGGRRAAAWQKIKSSEKPIGALLLDQSVVAGVGNIFRAEVLFEAEVDPRIRGCDLASETFDRIWRVLVRMMKTGLKYGRIISVTAREAGRPLAWVTGSDRFRVYGKPFCPVCEAPVETIELASRKLYLCRRCQRV